MPTYLMTWNSRDPAAWPRMSRDASIIALGDKPKMWWRCGHSKTIVRDDRLILFRQGNEPRGVIGTARAISDWRKYEEGGPKQPSRTKNEVRIEIETLIDSELDDPLTIEEMDAAGIRGVRWNVQESGTRVDDAAADAIVQLWSSRSGVVKEQDDLSGIEGELTYRLVRHRKRERQLRKAAIDRALLSPRGLVCEVLGCNFDFESCYGDIGRGFAHVHHRGKLSDRSHPSTTRLSDLAIVCANCHAMIHVGGKNRDLTTLIPNVT